MKRSFYLLLSLLLTPIYSQASEKVDPSKIIGHIERVIRLSSGNGVYKQVIVELEGADKCEFLTLEPEEAIRSNEYRIYIGDIKQIKARYSPHDPDELEALDLFTKSGKKFSWNKGHGQIKHGYVEISRNEKDIDCQKSRKGFIYEKKGEAATLIIKGFNLSTYNKTRKHVTVVRQKVKVTNIINLDLSDNGKKGKELFAKVNAKIDKNIEQAKKSLAKQKQKEKVAEVQRSELLGPIKIKKLKTRSISIQSNMKSVLGAVVTVLLPNGSSGSGFFIDENGYVITNYHVVTKYKDVTLKLYNGGEVKGQVIRSSTSPDIALIKTQPMRLEPLPIRYSKIEVGQEVYAIGSPKGLIHDSTVSRGIVSAYRRVGKDMLLQSDVNVLKGSSGGPLLDSNGNVVALTVSGYKEGYGINYFIPIKLGIEALSLVAE